MISALILFFVFLIAQESESGDSKSQIFVSTPYFRLTNLNKVLLLENLTLDQSSKRILFRSQFEFRCSVWFDSFCKPEFLSWTFWLDLIFWSFVCASLLVYLCMLLFACDRIPGLWSVLLRVSRFCESSARQVTLWSYPFITQFLCIRSNPHTLH